MSTKLLRLLLILAMSKSSLSFAQLQLVTPFSGSTCGGSTFANAISANGVLTCATPSASSVVLSGITAATTGNTISSGNNTGQVWNWANTTNSTTAFTLGETSAATGGTSTSGIPNQVLAKISTLAGSTMSPLSISVRGAHAVSISPTTGAILSAPGSAAAPAFSFAAANDAGISYSSLSNYLQLSISGQAFMFADGTNVYTRAPNVGSLLTDSMHANSGVFWPAISTFGIAIGNAENSRFLAEGWQASKGAADAVSYAVNARKSRGTVASPTVITTGDDLLAINGAGYVGGTNTYRSAATISFTSTGTISDATNGIGGNIKLSTQKQGTDTVPQERARVDQLGHIVSIAGTANTPNLGTCGTLPSVTGTDNAMLVTVGTGSAANSCSVNFGSTWAGNAPVCVAQNDTDIVAYKIATTTTAVTITAAAAFTALSRFHVHCMGMQ